MSKISIIIPVYNAEQDIERCAVSLFEQTHGDLEYVFVNDFTPDDSMAVLARTLDKYPQRREQVKVIDHPSNRGIAAARNTGLDNATGEFLMFVDSDDYIPTHACSTLLDKLQESGADIVSGAFEKILLNDERIIVKPLHSNKELFLKALLTQALVTPNLWGRIYRRKLITDNHFRWEEGVNMAEDYVMNATMMYYAERMSWTDEVVYHYDFSRPPKPVSIYKPHVMQQFYKANRTVLDFFSEKSRKAVYWHSVQCGLLYLYRAALQGGRPLSDLAVFEPYLSAWTKPLIVGFSHKCTFGITNFIYKTIRKVIVSR